MKKLIITCILTIFTVTFSMAAWVTDFQDNFEDSGIDQAVIYALEEGADPYSIVENGLQLDGLNPVELIMALYCAGVNGEDIQAAAKHWEVTEEIVAEGYQKSIVECDMIVVDTQAYTQNSGSSLKGGNTGYASPSTF